MDIYDKSYYFDTKVMRDTSVAYNEQKGVYDKYGNATNTRGDQSPHAG